MRITRRTAVIIAVVCAAGAALLMVIYLQSLAPKPTSQPKAERVAVPVPLSLLTAGTRITADQLTSKNVPADSVPADAITKPEELYGQVLVADVQPGWPILRSALAANSPQAGLAFVVPNGLRAVTVAVDNITGVSGFLKLGDHVDVLATFEAGQRVVTRTILQDVQVLGLGAEGISPQAAKTEASAGAATPAAAGAAAAQTGGDAAPPPPGGVRPSATLAVSPQQAQVLVLAATKGKLHLALRPKSDNRMVALPPASNAEVVGVPLIVPSPPPAGPPTPASTTVNAMAAAGGRAGAGLTPGAGGPGGAPGAGGPAARTGPTVEVFKGTTREVVIP